MIGVIEPWMEWMGVLYLSPILLIKSKFNFKPFAPSENLEISFRKISAETIPSGLSHPNKAIYLVKFPLNYPQLVCCRKSQSGLASPLTFFLIIRINLTLLVWHWMLRVSLVNVI